jgi:septum site-determining protein MinC
MNARVGSFSAIQFSARSLLAFVLEPTQPLAPWFESLDDWLSRSPNFFASKPVILQMAGLDISLKDYRDLLGDLARRHIRVMAAENANRTLVGPHLPPVVAGGRAVNALKLLEDESPAAEAPAQSPPVATPVLNNSLFIDSNLRSGQSIAHLDGDVTIVGRVASGAEIIAGGSVHVYGALQGRVIAGVSGAANARIFCKEARAEMLCIGGAYVTAEDMDPKIDGRGVEVTLNGDELQIRILN